LLAEARLNGDVFAVANRSGQECGSSSKGPIVRAPIEKWQCPCCFRPASANCSPGRGGGYPESFAETGGCHHAISCAGIHSWRSYATSAGL